MKKLISVIFAFILVICAVSCGQERVEMRLYTEGTDYSETQKRAPKEVYALSYEIMGGEEVMPIGGFYAPYTSGGSLDGHALPDFITDYYFEKLQQCGINMFVYSVDRWNEGGGNAHLEKALDLCEKYGIGYFVDTYWVMGQLGTHTTDVPLEQLELNTSAGVKKLENLINELSKNGERKSFIGLHSFDEPFTAQLDNIGVLTDKFYGLENTEGLDVFLNARGYWAGEDNFWGYSDPMQFDEYMQRLFDESNPRMLSVTQYPYTSADTPESTLTSLMTNCLSVYRHYANENKVPFWRMLQAGGQWNDLMEWIDSVEPYPSEGELLYDVNLALAYGAKAIQYFPLIQPLHFAYQTGGTYDFENRSGLIGADGNLTRWYYYAQRANRQVQAIDHVLMKSANEGIIVHGPAATKAIVTDGEPGDAVISSGNYRELKSVRGDDCIVGCFDYQGGTALYVVNYSRTEKADVELVFDKNDYLYEVIQRAESVKTVGNGVSLRLDCGEGALIVLA